MKKVCVVGLDTIGLPTAILVAKAGLQVIGVDRDEAYVESLNQCSFSAGEPEVIDDLRQVCGAKNFYATTTCEQADYFIVAAPTSVTKDKTPHILPVSTAATEIGAVIKKGDTVILESTGPVGITLSFAQVIEAESGLKAGRDFYVAYCPEHAFPGNTLQELKVNDRIIGGIDQTSAQKASEFYKYFVSGDLYLTNAATAELVKLIESSARDLDIAFAQEVAAMAAQEGLNPFEVIELANKHPRVSILKPSCGVGGKRVVVDPWFLSQSFPKQSALLKTARSINDNRAQYVLSSIKTALEEWKMQYKKPCTVLLLGLTYKADVKDLSSSPALAITLQLLQDSETTFLITEPCAPREALDTTLHKYLVSLQEGLEVADIVVGLVPHEQFFTINKSLKKEKTVLDYCGLFFEPRKESIEQEQFFWPASSPSKQHVSTVVLNPHIQKTVKEEQV